MTKPKPHPITVTTVKRPVGVGGCQPQGVYFHLCLTCHAPTSGTQAFCGAKCKGEWTR